MAVGFYKNLFNAATAAAESPHVDGVDRGFSKFLIKTVGFSGSVDLMGVDNAGGTGPVNVLYLYRDVTNDTYDPASVDQLTYTTDTGVYVAVVVGEAWRELYAVMDRDAGSITIDYLLTETAPLQLTTADVTVESLTVGAVTIANGADSTQGAVANSANTNPAASATVNANLKGLLVPIAPMTLTPTAVDVDSTEAEVLASNAARTYALFQNDSDTVIYLQIDDTAVAHEGIRLAANGGSYEMSRALGNLSTAAIDAITLSGDNKRLLIVEGENA